MGNLEVLNSGNFDKETSEGLVLIDFYADWCGPCKMLTPFVEAFAAETTDYKVYKVNVDDSGDIAEKFNIQTIPTLIIFKDGEKVDQTSGFMTGDDLKEFVNKSL